MSQPKILLVDDEAVNLDYLQQELEDLNYEIILARNGLEALNQIRLELPDLILLDIMMPFMDGFAVLRELKADSRLRDIPVIVISAMHDLASMVDGIKQGAEDYLPKPFEPTLLHARIAASLEKKLLRDQQRKLLHTFATEEIAEEMLKNGFSLGGRNMDASIMFVDIRAFTTYTEQHAPAEVIEFLNSYFEAMFAPIAHHGGIVNQIIGDGFMALFGTLAMTTDHRTQAALTAMEMMVVLDEFNRKRAEQNALPIKIGIGIASGKVIAGYVGTQHRATYTCVGDAVNLASRLENYTKVAACPILMEEETCANLPATIPIKLMGQVLFKGKATPVTIYTIGK